MNNKGRKAIWLDPRERDLARDIFHYSLQRLSNRIGITSLSSTEMLALVWTEKEVQALLLKFEEENKTPLANDSEGA